MNPELIRRTQQFLFASEEEMQKEHVPQDVRQRIYRLRDMYSYWLRNPKLGDKHILAEIKRRNGIGDTQAYEDLRLLKLCLGNLQQMTRDWYQYLFIARCEEGFQMARDKGDAGAFAKVLASLGKFTRLDHEVLTGPDYSQIIPQQFEMTSDPSVAGFKRIPNVLKIAVQMEKRYIKEIEAIEYETIEVKPIKPIDDNEAKLALHTQD
ncbi:MAG: hypothetical protein IKO20_09305 [Bacteroidaceae bacterium]|nr:hypothetical protein [Bacteroidaceae bacterium]